MIQFFNVSKRYPGGRSALEDVSVAIARGEFIFLTGASGAGKTTFLKLLYREEMPTSGQILVNGRNVSSLPRKKIPYLRRTMGIVFQDFRLIARKTVLENVNYLPRIQGVDAQERKRMAYRALRRVGLGHLLSSFPRQLSGGEQQRVAIARALVGQPDILIADEPTGNLDPELSLEIFNLLHEVHLRGTTLLIATHDRALIERMGYRVITLDRGRLIRDTPASRIHEPPSSEPGEGRDDERGVQP